MIGYYMATKFNLFAITILDTNNLLQIRPIIAQELSPMWIFTVVSGPRHFTFTMSLSTKKSEFSITTGLQFMTKATSNPS